MPWSLEWRFTAELGLLRIHWRAASRLGAAVHRFVATSEGSIERTQDPHVIRLRVRGAVALLRIHAATRTVEVLAIFAD